MQLHNSSYNPILRKRFTYVLLYTVYDTLRERNYPVYGVTSGVRARSL